jgi:hypothetical protein
MLMFVSWTVTQVPMTDVYNVELTSTFTAQIPMPVVTSNPVQVDMDVLEEGLMPVVTFEITNHGLIAAKNFTFTLPSDTHPFILLRMVRMLENCDFCVITKSL